LDTLESLAFFPDALVRSANFFSFFPEMRRMKILLRKGQFRPSPPHPSK